MTHCTQARVTTAAHAEISSIFVSYWRISFHFHSLQDKITKMEFPSSSGSKKRKGGQQQRLQKATENLHAESALQSLLMTYLAQGILSGVFVHSIAQAAQKDIQAARDGYSLPDLDKLSNLVQGKNLMRSVHYHLAKTSTLPKAFQEQVPYKDGSHPTSILLPHEQFAAMFENGASFNATILPSTDVLTKFWQAFDGHPAMSNHPVKDKKNYTTHGIPLSFHGDEVPVVGVGKIWSRSCLAFSWCSMVAKACGFAMDDIFFYIWAVFDKFCIDSTSTVLGTMDTFFSILKWSFQALFDGIWPTRNWQGRTYKRGTVEWTKAGKPLANGHFGVLLQFSGDLDYFVKFLGLPQYSTLRNLCAQCKCQYSGPRSWLDNRENSGWQQNLLSAGNWRTWWTTRCPLFSLPGVSALSIALDYMHNMYLGWLQYFYGSVMFLLCHECLGQDPLTNLRTVSQFFQTYQKEHKVQNRYRHRLDKLSMFKKKTGFPKLKGRAADIKGLDSTISKCWQSFMDHSNPQHVQIAAFLELNVQIANILHTYSPTFGYLAIPEEPHAQFRTAAMTMAQLHVQLQDHYKTVGQQLFNITSKTHFVLHAVMLSRYIHPSLNWCFLEKLSWSHHRRFSRVACLGTNIGMSQG